ncbi:MAG TPA: hypothetical protein VL947_03640, partial [Cytophagales bacterium]|nr:hypothetical protein [Cytophagales bacterium]
MKRIAVIILIFISLWVASAQTVSVPDQNLKSCLIQKYPKAFDASQNLIIAEASKIPDPIGCPNRNIKNAEGLQYFTNIAEIDLSKNQLTFLPELSGLTKLVILNVSENQIVALPELKNLGNLSHLDVRRNLMKTLPELPLNLFHLNANTNQLDTFPPLDALVKLNYLNVAENKLRYLPGLDKLTALTTLICWGNTLKELAPLHGLNQLMLLDASRNHLTHMPALSTLSKIENIYMDRNQLTTVPDLSICKSLKKVRLYGNKLTFEDLVPLASIKRYDTILTLSPQSKLMVGKVLEVGETHKALLKTGIDTNVSGIEYDWFFNGTPYRSSTFDTLSPATSSVSNTGYYYCKISHPSFPELSLVTDSFHVKVLPCINVSGFSTTVTASNCLQPGSLKIDAHHQPTKDLQYSLKSTNSGKLLSSSTGIFKNLTEVEYTLAVQAGKSCIKELPDKVV